MPLTPLHLAVGLPARRWVDLRAFIMVNLLIDLQPAMTIFFNMDSLGYPIHGWSHSQQGISSFIVLVLLFGLLIKDVWPWVLGTVWGGISHLILDGLVHPDIPESRIYLGVYHEVSGICAAILIYYLTKWVISLRIGEVAPTAFRNFWRRLLSR